MKAGTGSIISVVPGAILTLQTLVSLGQARDWSMTSLFFKKNQRIKKKEKKKAQRTSTLEGKKPHSET